MDSCPPRYPSRCVACVSNSLPSELSLTRWKRARRRRCQALAFVWPSGESVPRLLGSRAVACAHACGSSERHLRCPRWRQGQRSVLARSLGPQDPGGSSQPVRLCAVRLGHPVLPGRARRSERDQDQDCQLWDRAQVQPPRAGRVRASACRSLHHRGRFADPSRRDQLLRLPVRAAEQQAVVGGGGRDWQAAVERRGPRATRV